MEGGASSGLLTLGILILETGCGTGTQKGRKEVLNMKKERTERLAALSLPRAIQASIRPTEGRRAPCQWP